MEVHVTEFDITGRAMKGWVLVEPVDPPDCMSGGPAVFRTGKGSGFGVASGGQIDRGRND